MHLQRLDRSKKIQFRPLIITVLRFKMLQQIFLNSPFHNSDRKFAFFMLLMMMMMIVLDKQGLIRCRKMKLLKAKKKNHEKHEW